jgi:23S rRNA (uracil1939-C5)-methyltransferase
MKEDYIILPFSVAKPVQFKLGVYADVIVVDPPRKGCDETLLETMVEMNPDRIVYVSCDSATLARDLKYLCERGYELRKVCPVDQFGMTVHVETVVLLSHKKPDGHINVKVEFGEGEGKVPLDNIAKRAEEYKPKERVTYKMIKEYIEAKYGFKVHTAYIAEVKRDLGLPMYDAPNAVEELKQPRKHPTAEKVEAIKDALKHFEVI